MGAASPSTEDYDVVVIGAGFGGLSAGACLAAAGRSVLVVERLDGPGGYGHAFRRGPYTFDPAIHFTCQAGEGQFLDFYLRLLGVRDRCTLVRQDTFYGVDFPGLRWTAPAGVDAFVDAHARLFPEQAEHIGRFVQVCAQITRESQELPPRLSLKDLDEAARRLPTLFRYRTAALTEVLGDHVTDERAQAVLTAFWPYVGVPPSKLGLVDYAAFLLAIVEPGPFYCEGSFQNLADALADALGLHGGELLLETTVREITVAGGRTTGVVLEDGRRIRAEAVVSNADAHQTFTNLVGVEQLPQGFARRLERLTPSLSGFVLYMATSMDVQDADLAHETFVHPHWDHDATYADILDGRPGGMWMSVPTLVDPSVAPPGEHLVTFSSLARYDAGRPWTEAKEDFTERTLHAVEGVLPGFGDHITFLEPATPLTFERYSGNQRGALYGWDHIPSQTVPRRMGHDTPVEGLYLSGHWTEPGSGSFRTIYSGFQTAQLLLGYDRAEPLMEALAARTPVV